MQEAATLYLRRAVEKLRSQGSLAGSVHVYIRTNPHKKGAPQHCQEMTIPLPEATDDLMRLARVARWGVKQLYRPGFEYQKVGVMLSELVPLGSRQGELFAPAAVVSGRAERLMHENSISGPGLEMKTASRGQNSISNSISGPGLEM